ncbi:MAG: DNA polymerase III subunit beta [Syntrophobacterales bacterium]|jgi:DNA polymerase-3 subunit beta|nr:DNA polymerase III subunit beta [Syntrophobacterales bacterium]
MQISIEQETLSKAIGHVLGVVDKRGTLPILSHCLLQTDGNGVFISATDLEIGFRGFYPAEITKPGDLTVPADFLNKLIKGLPKGTLALVGTDNAGLQIQTGDSQYRLYGLPGEQFPSLPEAAGASLVEVESPLLKEMISKTIFSAVGGNNDLPSNLSGVFWEEVEVEGNNHLRLASTDGHRLTLIERPLPEGEQLNLGKGILVPCKGMREICRFLEGQEKVTLGLGEKTLTVQAADKHLSVRLLDRKFPDYRRIIPEGFAFRFSINRRELNNTLKRMAQLSSDRFKGMIFNLTADSVEVTFADPEVGEGRDKVPVILESGDAAQLPLEVGFNGRYLMEPLQVIPGDTVILEINDRDHPCRLMGKDDHHYLNMIMPVSSI